MNTDTAGVTDATTIPPIDHAEAFGPAEEEYRLFAEALERLGPDDWHRPTDCEGWDVRHLAGHVLGAMRAAASLREQLSQQREIRRRVKATGDNEVDVMTAVQVERTADLAPQGLVAEVASLVTAAANGRRNIPAPLRKFVRFRVVMGPIDETWTLGYLVDTTLTRDIFMHRIDVARAVGERPVLDGRFTRRIVDDVVGEWTRRHGDPVDLTLTGELGHRYLVDGDSPEVIEIDAVEFCRTLSGRAAASGLLEQQVPF